MKALPSSPFPFAVLCLLLALLTARADDKPVASGDPHLVEVTFSLNDLPAGQAGSDACVYWLSAANLGWGRKGTDVDQGGGGPTPDAHAKATQCMKLLQAIPQPKNPPEPGARMLVVKCTDGATTLSKIFPLDQLPQGVFDILACMGFDAKDSNGPDAFLKSRAH